MDSIEITKKCGDNNMMLQVSRRLLSMRREIRDIPIESVKVSEFWIRRDWQEDLDSLAESIDIDGLLQFPAVRDNGDGTFTLVFGHRRYLACKQSGRTTIPCYILDVTAEDAAFLMLTENLHIKQLHPVDEAQAIRRIAREFNLQDAAVARRMGRKANVINERLAVLVLPPEMLAEVSTDSRSRFTFTHALTLAKLWDDERSDRQVHARQLYEKTIRHALTTLELKALASLIKEGDFDHLPERLKMYFMSSELMTAAMVGLFFHPESIVPGKDRRAKAMKAAAKRLQRHELEDLIVKVIEAGWSYEKACQQLLKRLGKQVDASDENDTDQSTGVDRLMSCISLLDKQLDGSRDEVEELAKSDPARFRSVRFAIVQLRKKLHSITVLASEVTSDVNVEKNVLVETTNVNAS
jgi:ParB/RepB/Spo0J family partition protein